MRIIDTTTKTFSETVTERLFTAERRLRQAVQQDERETKPLGEHGTVRISRSDARTLLRVILPATLALGRTRKPTLQLHGAMAAFMSALIGAREPAQLGPALATANDLADALAAWIAETRWRQATTAAGVSWRRPAETQPAAASISALLRQSTAAKPEHARNAADRPAPTSRAPARGQRSLLLPIAGGTTAAAAPIAATTAPPPTQKRPRKAA